MLNVPLPISATMKRRFAYRQRGLASVVDEEVKRVIAAWCLSHASAQLPNHSLRRRKRQGDRAIGVGIPSASEVIARRIYL